MAQDKEIKTFFESLYSRYNKAEYIHTDPIRFPHELGGNAEFIAFTAAAFAYGNMKAIQSFLYRYFDYAGTDPLKLNDKVSGELYYRFQTAKDVAGYSSLMKGVYNEYGSIGRLFRVAGAKDIDTVARGIVRLRSSIGDMTQGMNFLMPVPGKSASKRLHMFLRWMVRSDDIDLGLWNGVFDKGSLYMPVDTHIMRMAVNYGIVGINESGKEAAVKVTEFFKTLNPDDPAKYDFSITRLGIVTGCKYSENEQCKACVNNEGCLFQLTFGAKKDS